ncbi:tail terminator [Microbacterium phage WaterT]|nr:tail terminator [Microbacterium phage WaterT]QDK01434.1 tail terminator [Microbacterium phage LeeroyJenkins]QOC59359.1 tail terminator [Microbacterium phage Lifes]USH44492.1 tail terminator [Microbacterium phage Cassita]
MPSISQTQEEILELLRDEFAQPIVEQGVPDISTVKRNGVGDIDPYIAVQFGDLQQGRATSMVGPRGDDYILPIYVQCIAPEVGIARQLQNKILDVMLGAGFPWSGNVRKRPGGGMYTMTNSNSATEAYTFPASFGLTVQFE